MYPILTNNVQSSANDDTMDKVSAIQIFYWYFTSSHCNLSSI